MDIIVCREKIEERKSMTKAKVSIIVPFYNTEKYIGICLKSLTEQIYSDIEIICINDGSTDNSRAIVEEFQKEDERIQLIDQKNSGVGIARKRGLQIASGKYIMFCDSDDYYEPGMVATMAECMETHADVDLAICNSFIHHISGQKRNLQSYLYHNKHGASDLTQSVKHKKNILLWNKIFRKELWNKYKLASVGKRGDDENLVFKYLSVSKKIYYVKDQLYNHIIREDSLIGKVDTYSFLTQFLTHLNDIANFLDTNNLWSTNADFYARKVLHVVKLFDHQDSNIIQKPKLYTEIVHIARRVKKHHIIDVQTKNAIYAIQNGHIDGNQFTPELGIEKTEKSVPVVFACDDNYIKYLTVTLQSIIENSSHDYLYHIIILDCGIKPENTGIIQEQIAKYKNFTLNIVSARAFLEKYKDSFKEKGRFTAAIYGRLFIPEIFRNFDKVIYAEVDMIFNRDIAELMTIDLKDNYIAATIDLSMEAVFNSAKRYSYVQNELRQGIRSYYILSGFMVFNIRQWRKNFLIDKCVNLLKEHLAESPWADQDAINLACKNKIYYLDQSWNCCPFIEHRLKDNDFIQTVKTDKFMEELSGQYVTVLTRPDTVFHYATPRKPWNTPPSDLKYAEKWWAYCRKTEFYEEILFQSTSGQIQDHVIGINPQFPDPLPQEMKNSNSHYISLIKKYYLLGLAVIKIKLTNESKKYYFFGMRIAKTVKNQHKKKYYILGLRIFTLKVWKKSN